MRIVETEARLGVLVMAFCLCFLAFGEATEETRPDGAKKPRFKGEVKVTAQPVEEGPRIDDLGGKVDVVGREQVKSLGAQDLSTALRRVPGVTISRYNLVGAYGGADGGAVFVRGHGTGRPGAEITTAVDGIPRFVGIWTHPLVDTLSLDLASRIEVFKTPQPVRYGNMAFGVVDMVPRKGRGPGSGEIWGLYGSHSTMVGLAEAEAGWDGGDVLAVLSHRESDGHRPRSAGRVDAAFLNLGVDAGRGWEARLLLSATDAWADDPGVQGTSVPPVTPRFDDGDVFSILSASRAAGAHGRLEVKGYWDSGSVEDRQWDEGALESFTSFTDWRNRGLRIAYEGKPRGGATTVAAGLDHDVYGGNFVERHPSDDRLATDLTFRSSAAWALVRHDTGGRYHVTPSLGLRVTDTRYFGTQWGAQGGIEAKLGDVTVYANGARAFNLPGVYAAVMYAGWNRPGEWKDLDPEQLTHWELGAMGAGSGAVSWSMSLFRDRVTDAIRFAPPPPFPPSFANIGEYTLSGVEATLGWQASSSFAVFLGGTAMHSDPSEVPESPDWTASMGISWRPVPSVTCTFDVEAISDRWVLGTRFPSQRTELESFLLLNGTVRLRLPAVGSVKRAELRINAENLGDEDYEYRPGYPMPGRTILAGLVVGF